MVVLDDLTGGGDDELQLASVLPPGGEQAIARQPGRRILAAANDLRARAQRSSDLVPQRRRGVKDEEVHLAPASERGQDLEIASRQAREPEQG